MLNWKKCHFTVKEGIMLGHKILEHGIEVDKAKIKTIANLPPPTLVKGVRNFLVHAEFYRRFIKDFSKIAKPLCTLLKKDIPFKFNEEGMQAFRTLKEKLTLAPIMIALNWSLLFEIMYDTSDYAIGAILSQRNNKRLLVIYYSSRVLNDTQLNYATIKKEMLAIVFAHDKFYLYFIRSKSIVFIDHSTIKYLLEKRESKPKIDMMGSFVIGV